MILVLHRGDGGKFSMYEILVVSNPGSQRCYLRRVQYSNTAAVPGQPGAEVLQILNVELIGIIKYLICLNLFNY